MQLSEETAADVTIVVLRGRLDSQSAPRLTERLSALLGNGPPRVLIEASQLSYVSSAGLRALLIADRRAAEAGGVLALCGLTAPVRHVVELGGFGQAFATYASREAAMERLSAA